MKDRPGQGPQSGPQASEAAKAYLNPQRRASPARHSGRGRPATSYVRATTRIAAVYREVSLHAFFDTALTSPSGSQLPTFTPFGDPFRGSFSGIPFGDPFGDSFGDPFRDPFGDPFGDLARVLRGSLPGSPLESLPGIPFRGLSWIPFGDLFLGSFWGIPSDPSNMKHLAGKSG